jgi:uncharacterized membrane protein
MTFLFLLKIVHIAAASVWIGGGLSAAPDIRRTLSLGEPHSAELMPRLRGVAKLMNLSALLTLVSGLAIVFAVGGFARVPHRIHAGLALTLLAIIVGRWMIRPVIGDIAQATRTPVAREQLDRIVTRFRVAVGVEHALRLAVLVLMVYPFTF